jgi:two-component system cell cycle sensor histidine kinase/response regulator CckA
VEHPLVRRRPSSSRRRGTETAGAVSGVSVLSLAVATGALRALVGLGIAGVFGVTAPLLPLPRRRRASGLDGARGYRSTFDHLPLATLVARASDLGLVYASPEAERVLGLPRAPRETLAELWESRLHEADRARVLEEWRTWLAGAGHEAFRSEHRLVSADGRTLTVDAVATRAGSDVIAHLLDVTRERRLEAQLRQAQRLELLGRLAAGVAHDFNNLLAVITGYAARLSTPLPPDARAESTGAIAAAADRGASLVRQLLAFSRPQPTESRVVDLNDLVREFEPMLRRVIGEDLEFELRLDPQRLPVDVHPIQIDQVLMNVAVNARDAMPGGGRLTIGTWKLDGVAVVTVADTGVGIDESTQEHIFEPFFSTKEPTHGSGLGLATAETIVRQAGGSMTVSSAPGEGTTFRIDLPLAAAPDTLGHLDAIVDPTTPDGGPETVLVVEDEPALRELEKLMLEEAGYAVLTAANAAEALLVAAANAIDLLIVDVVMPGMSGPQLVEELAARGSHVPTVYISGYGADEVSSRGFESETTALIEKPFHAESLLRRVREVLDAAAQTAAAPKDASRGEQVLPRDKSAASRIAEKPHRCDD